MYRTPSKQRQLAKRVLVYGCMTLTVLLMVTALVFLMLGYRFNRATSTIEQGGLVQFVSRPTNAKVTIGTAQLANRTPSKITVNPGVYNVTMTKDGYRTWAKTADVHAGKVLWLNYAQLVPKTIKTKQTLAFDAVADAVVSPNGDRYALLEDAAAPTLTMLDVTGSTPKQATLTLPESTLPNVPADQKVAYDIATWANDSDRFLMRATHGKAADWLLVDRRDETKAVNLTTRYGISIAEAMFDPRESNQIIVRTAKGELLIIDTGDNTASDVLATNVTYMSLQAKDAMLVVRKISDTVQSVGYVSFGSHNVRELQQVESSASTRVAGSTYFSEPYIAITVGNQLDVYKVGSLPSSESTTPISMTGIFSTVLPAVADHLGIRTSGRFVLAQYGTGLMTYDIELDKQSVTSFKTPVTTELRWLDRYHFYLTDGANLHVLEFDGGNAHAITPLTTQFDATQSDDGKYIYSIAAHKNGYSLQRSQMILDN